MNRLKKYKEFINEVNSRFPSIKVKTNEYFKNHTTFRIGGKIAVFIEVADETILLCLLHLVKKYNIDYFILGNGSNLLCQDSFFDKLVIKIKLNYFKVKHNFLIGGSGINLYKLNLLAQKEQLSGLEWSFGIPASVGGAVKMNAGCFGKEMQDVVFGVYYTDGNNVYFLNNKDCKFSYRNSFFSNKNLIILRVIFKLQKDDSKKIEKLCNENLKKKMSLQPYEQYSAGSVFKKGSSFSIPPLIERCNLKGIRCGYAQISTKHCGFIVNLSGKATFRQVFKLINKIKKTVWKKFAIMINEEIIIVKN